MSDGKAHYVIYKTIQTYGNFCLNLEEDVRHWLDLKEKYPPELFNCNYDSPKTIADRHGVSVGEVEKMAEKVKKKKDTENITKAFLKMLEEQKAKDAKIDALMVVIGNLQRRVESLQYLSAHPLCPDCNGKGQIGAWGCHKCKSYGRLGY